MLQSRKLRATLILTLSVFPLLILSPSPILPQEAPAQTEGTERVRLFMDCNAMGCFDLDYLRTEIQFVNWVRDIRDADVYLLITALGTGAGGASSELIFTGQGRFEGMADTLTHISGFDATSDEQREGIAKIMKIGLMRYVGLTDDAVEIEIGLRRRPMGPGGLPGGGPPGGGAVTPEDDPWDFWIFRVSGNGNISGRTNYASKRVGASVTARRTTEEWKTSLSLSSSYSDTRYDYPDLDYNKLSVRRSQTFNGSLTKAVAAKWSAGLKVSAQNDTYYNLDFGASLAPILEYSVFPYEEATRKSLTFQYSAEGIYNDYREETVYFKETEGFLTQSLSANLSFNRPWGSAYAILEGAHHFEDVDLHHISIFGGVTVRLGRGLSLSLNGSASRVKDLISVAADADDSVEEILLRRRQFQTEYTYSTSISLSYSFGSIFNNIVNPRIGGGGGMGIGMIIM